MIAARIGNGHEAHHGVISSVRTYESPIDRRLEEAGFELESSVTLLLREALVRVAEPALVPPFDDYRRPTQPSPCTADPGGPVTAAPARNFEREAMDDLELLLAALPPEVVEAVHALPDQTSLIEVVLDLGRPPEARFPNAR